MPGGIPLPLDAAEWIADDRALTVAVENALAHELGLGAGQLLLDYPVKTQMLGLDMLVQRSDGEVRRLTASGWEGEGAINLPKLSEEFYRSARGAHLHERRHVSRGDPRPGHAPRLPTRRRHSRPSCSSGEEIATRLVKQASGFARHTIPNPWLVIVRAKRAMGCSSNADDDSVTQQQIPLSLRSLAIQKFKTIGTRPDLRRASSAFAAVPARPTLPAS